MMKSKVGKGARHGCRSKTSNMDNAPFPTNIFSSTKYKINCYNGIWMGLRFLRRSGFTKIRNGRNGYLRSFLSQTIWIDLEHSRIIIIYGIKNRQIFPWNIRLLKRLIETAEFQDEILRGEMKKWK